MNTQRHLYAGWVRLRLFAQYRQTLVVVANSTKILQRAVPGGCLFDMCTVAVQEIAIGRDAAAHCTALKAEVAKSVQLRRDVQADYDLHNFRMQAAIERLSQEVLSLTLTRKEMLAALTQLSTLLQAAIADLRSGPPSAEVVRELIFSFSSAAERTQVVVGAAMCSGAGDLPQSSETPAISPRRSPRSMVGR